MEMSRLISLQRIFALKYACRDDIDEIDEVYADHRHSCRDLTSCDDSECRDEKSEHYRS